MQETSKTPERSRRNNPPWPIVAAFVGIGLLAFLIGRGTSPQSVNDSTAISNIEQAKEENHDGEGEEHGADEHGHEEHGGEEIKFAGDAAQTANVRVQPVAFSAQNNSIPFTGQIAHSPDRTVRVSSVVPGRITRLYVAIGDKVKRGQTLAIVESRAVGEAQAAYQQAQVRLRNARTNYDVVQKQARAGVFSRVPIEAARRAQVEAAAEVRTQETAVRQASIALDNARRLARTGAYASPALEAGRGQAAQATAALRSAEAALTAAQSGVRSAQNELNRRRQLAASGAYVSRPVEEAKRTLVAARAAKSAAQSEVATARSNLNRARSLSTEGLIARRELEAAQQTFDAATSRLRTAEADEDAAGQELERQQKLASSNVAEAAEVSAAQSALEDAQAGVRTRTAEVGRAREGVRLADVALSRERAIFQQNIANRREVSQAEGTLETTRNALVKARQSLDVANAAYERERRILRQDLNNVAQVQAARSAFLQAQSDVKAAQTALWLLKSSPGGRASVPIVAPLSGTVEEREVAEGEVIDADRPLMTITDLSLVHVDMFLPESDISRVRIGAPVSVRIDAVPRRSFAGRIELIHTELDPKTRTVEAHAEVPNNGALRIGMSARGRITVSGSVSVIAVPAAAVQEMEGRRVVFIAADEPNTFLARPVEIGTTQGGKTVIKSGLKPGDKVVVQGAFIVKAQAMKAELGHEH